MTLEHLADEFRVEGGGRLVEQHQLGPHRQCPGNGYPLLLSAGELSGVGVGASAESDPLQQLPGLFGGLLAIYALYLGRALDDVAERGHVRKEVEPLEDHADLGALAGDLAFPEFVQRVAGRPVTDELAVDVQAARVNLFEVVDAPQKGRLAGPGRADQAHHLALGHLQGDALEHLDPAKGLVDVDSLYEQVPAG